MVCELTQNITIPISEYNDLLSKKQQISISDADNGCFTQISINGAVALRLPKGLVWSARMASAQILPDAVYTGVQAVEDAPSPLGSWNSTTGEFTFACGGTFIATAQVNVHLDGIFIGPLLDVIISTRQYTTLNSQPFSWFHSGENIRQVPTIVSEEIDSQDSTSIGKAFAAKSGDILQFMMLAAETGETGTPVKTIEPLSFLSIAQIGAPQ